MAIETRRLDLDADFGLNAGFRCEQLPGGSVAADDRVVARGIRDIGRNSDIGIVDQAGPAAEFAVVAALARSQAVVVHRIHPIVATAEHQRQTAELELILRIDTDLLLRDGLVGEHRARKTLLDAVGRI